MRPLGCSWRRFELSRRPHPGHDRCGGCSCSPQRREHVRNCRQNANSSSVILLQCLPSCTTQHQRPWGLKIRRQKLGAGLLAAAAIGQDARRIKPSELTGRPSTDSSLLALYCLAGALNRKVGAEVLKQNWPVRLVLQRGCLAGVTNPEDLLVPPPWGAGR